MRGLTIFLDDGGVMNDNRMRHPEWVRLVAEFFPSRLGGAGAQWSAANTKLAPGLWDRLFLDQAREGLVDTYHAWSRRYQLEWLRVMAADVGVPVPDDEDEAFFLAVEAARFVTSNCRSWFGDAPEAIRALAAAGFTLNTASGEESGELHGYLSSMSVREHFSRLFGPDLVNAFKAGPVYYERAFVVAGLDPARCLVVDDSPEALGWAAAAGALTVLVDRDRTKRARFEGRAIDSLEGLPALVEKLEDRTR
jgi:beta-phosphoglucomutase-like phosphatase (HAD superfamily)